MDPRLLASTCFAAGVAVGFGGHALLFGDRGGETPPAPASRAVTLSDPAPSPRPSNAEPAEPSADSIGSSKGEWRARYEAIRDWGQRGEFLQRMVSESVERGDWKAAFDFLRSLPVGPQRSDALFALVGELSRRAPRQALDELVPLLDGIDRHNAVTEVAVNWSIADPRAALDFAASEEGAPFRAAFAELGAYELGAIDPADAFRRIDAMRETLGTEDYDHARTGLLAGWAKLDAAAALDYALNQSGADPSLQEIFAEAIVASRTSVDPAGALALVESAFPDPATREGAAGLVFEIWGQQDPAGAAAAASRLPAGESTDAIVVEIVREWRNYDEAAADRWLASFAALSPEARRSLELAPPEGDDSVSDSVP